MRLLGISGSLREASYNTRLLRAAGAQLPAGTDFEVHTGLLDVPPYEQERETAGPRPDAVRVLDEAIARADAVLVATPEYNGSFPGALKNVLDWASRPRESSPLRGKPVAVIGSSPGLFGAVWAQADLRRVLGAMGAQVVERELPVGQVDQAFADDGRLADEEQAATLQAVLDDLLDAAHTDEAVAA